MVDKQSAIAAARMKKDQERIDKQLAEIENARKEEEVKQEKKKEVEKDTIIQAKDEFVFHYLQFYF